MRRACLAAIAILLTAVAATAQQPPAAPSDARDAVVAARQAWVDAFDSRDPKRIVALYAPDAVFWGTTAKTIATNPEQVWAYFKDSGQRPNTRVTIDAEHVRVYGDVAIASGRYTFADVVDGVRGNIRPARFTFVFRRTGDRWLIVDHHSSRVPEP